MVVPTILIVDDEPTNLFLLTGLLRPDYLVRAANSGESALRAAANQPRPDLVLLDVMIQISEVLVISMIQVSNHLNRLKQMFLVLA